MTLRVHLHGGFGEKGRTCLRVDSGGYRLLLDAGVKISARETADYYPAISDDELRTLDAIILTHSHEDHLGALGWCIERGFRGTIHMTPETRREADTILADYATPAQRALLRDRPIDALQLGAVPLRLGPLRVSLGRSGHMDGCVWCCVDDGRKRLVYCGDIVPASAVFATDPLPRGDALVIDASYGDDNTGFATRAMQIREWIAAHPQGCVLPTPLYGRSAELLAIIDAPLAFAPGMRDALTTQLRDTDWLLPGISAMLEARVARFPDWHVGDPLPRAALLCHDGMGLGGPARSILAEAARTDHPTLFTGHVPARSPAALMVDQQRASWVRLPTHPTLAENLALIADCAAPVVIGHSCDRDALDRIAAHAPQLDPALATGDHIEI
ncbi:MAG: MBL fold metallo-hydrolase [Casimicrobiaceae bacterium]